MSPWSVCMLFPVDWEFQVFYSALVQCFWCDASNASIFRKEKVWQISIGVMGPVSWRKTSCSPFSPPLTATSFRRSLAITSEGFGLIGSLTKDTSWSPSHNLKLLKLQYTFLKSLLQNKTYVLQLLCTAPDICGCMFPVTAWPTPSYFFDLCWKRNLLKQ